MPTVFVVRRESFSLRHKAFWMMRRVNLKMLLGKLKKRKVYVMKRTAIKLANFTLKFNVYKKEG